MDKYTGYSYDNENEEEVRNNMNCRITHVRVEHNARSSNGACYNIHYSVDGYE